MAKKTQASEVHHEELVKGFYDQMKVIMDSSEQPIFLYLDDNHKACNSKFAALLGYKLPQEWAKISRVSGSICRREKSGNIIFGLLGCNEENGSLNQPVDFQEERRGNGGYDSHSRTYILRWSPFLGSLRDQRNQVSGWGPEQSARATSQRKLSSVKRTLYIRIFQKKRVFAI